MIRPLKKWNVVLILLALGAASPSPGQPAKKEQLTVELISHPDALVPSGPQHVSWRPRSNQLSFIGKNKGRDESPRAIWLYDAQTGSKQLLLQSDFAGSHLNLSSYEWSSDGNWLLIKGEGSLWLFDVNAKCLKRLTNKPGAEATAFSPAGDRIAFTRKNDIYVLNIKTGKIQRLTSGGSATVLNGMLDWVYKEELAYRATGQAYVWSPDGTKIAYLRLDDGPVPRYPLTNFLETHATLFDQRFPQPGDPNPVASLHVVGATGGGEIAAYHLHNGAEYIGPGFLWTPDSKTVCFLTLNRDQNQEILHLWNPSTGADLHPVVEKDPYWINNVEPPQFVDDGQRFLWLSERDGWIHLYLFARDGKLLKKLTTGDWMIDHPVFEDVPSFQTDEKGGWVYFESTKPDPRERQIFRVRLNGTDLERLSREAGTHALSLSPDGRFLADHFSSITIPPEWRLLKADGTYVATMKRPANHLAEYALGRTDFVTLKANDGRTLDARLVKPPDFDPHKKYPVIVYVYGGPHFQMIRNQWGTTSWLDQLFAEHGFLVWSLDNRGSWGRGHAFETVVFKNLGKHELQDQLAGVNYLKSLPYVDPNRMGIWGWSYGGYMTLYTLTHAPDIFKCGVAGAPVTDWHFYDSIYTERYMRTPQENPSGYEESSPVKAAGNLKAKLLLIHGVADDNVHMQNTINFIQALIQARIPYQLYLQPGQKHGFEGDVSILYRNMRIFDFFMHNL